MLCELSFKLHSPKGQCNFERISKHHAIFFLGYIAFVFRVPAHVPHPSLWNLNCVALHICVGSLCIRHDSPAVVNTLCILVFTRILRCISILRYWHVMSICAISFPWHFPLWVHPIPTSKGKVMGTRLVFKIMLSLLVC